MDPPGNLMCELRPYQKQALYWMIQMEKGQSMDETATTLHPCWEAYHLADKYTFGYLISWIHGFKLWLHCENQIVDKCIGCGCNCGCGPQFKILFNTHAHT